MTRPAAADCPDAGALEQLLLGQVCGAEAERLEAHVAKCPRCARTAQELPAVDALVRAMRDADLAERSPQQDLIDAVVPVLKRLSPADETETVPPRSGAARAAGNDTAGPLAVLAPAQTADELGRLGPYRVLGQLGAGGMGVVYVAEDPDLKRHIALKVIRPELVARADVRARFLREAQAVAAVEHDHIVAIHHVGEHAGAPYLAMPLLRGQTLEDRLRLAGGPLPMEEVLQVGREAAEALAAAHARGLVHRDIKPGNIFLEQRSGAEAPPSANRHDADATPAHDADAETLAPTAAVPTTAGAPESGGTSDAVAALRSPPGRVKVLDFGLAQVMHDAEGAKEGSVVGTPAYMSPEQGRGLAADARSDLFSLGCVLYRMSTGQPAFRGTDVVSVLMSIVLDQPPSPAELNPEVPPALAELIVRLLAKAPQDRPPSANAVADALRAIEQQRADATRPRPSRLPWILGSAAAVFVAALGAIGLTYYLVPPEVVEPPPPEPGQVTFTFDEPDPRVELQLSAGTVLTLDLREGATRTLPPGDYAVRVASPRSGRRLQPDRLHVAAGEASAVEFRLVGEVRHHQLHTRAIRAVALTPVRGSLLAASASDDGTIVLWDAATDHDPYTLGEHQAPVHCVAFAADGTRVASGSGGKGKQSDNSIRIWDVARRTEVSVLRGHSSWVTAVAFAPDGRHLVSGGTDGSVLLWDLRSGMVLRPLEGHAPERVYGVAFSTDGSRAVTCGGDGIIRVHDLAARTARHLRGHRDKVSAVRFAPDDSGRIASAGWDGTIRIWDGNGDRSRAIAAPSGAIHGLVWMPDGRRLLSAGDDGALRLWDAQSGDEQTSLRGHAGKVAGGAVSADGRFALSGGAADRTVRLWELPR